MGEERQEEKRSVRMAKHASLTNRADEDPSGLGWERSALEVASTRTVRGARDVSRAEVHPHGEAP
jgi:hypothetical protein